jgi:hypothetical protein
MALEALRAVKCGGRKILIMGDYAGIREKKKNCCIGRRW